MHLLVVAGCGISFTATYIPATLFSVYLYSKIKFHNVARIACFIFFTGAWIRSYSVSNQKFWPILAGEVWISLSCPLFFNMMTQFCGDWFPDNERTFVTALCGLTIPLGNLLAFIMSGLMFKNMDTPDLETRRDLVEKMIWMQNIWITLVTVPYFIILRAPPKVRQPSVIVQNESND